MGAYFVHTHPWLNEIFDETIFLKLKPPYDLATAQKFNFHPKFQKRKFSKKPNFSIEIPKMECV